MPNVACTPPSERPAWIGVTHMAPPVLGAGGSPEAPAPTLRCGDDVGVHAPPPPAPGDHVFCRTISFSAIRISPSSYASLAASSRALLECETGVVEKGERDPSPGAIGDTSIEVIAPSGSCATAATGATT